MKIKYEEGEDDHDDDSLQMKLVNGKRMIGVHKIIN